MKYWEVINDSINMRDVVSNCGLQVNRAGFACCPFHNEKTPSMKIYDKSYYCFGCHSGGKAVTFIQNYYNLSFKDACLKLNNDFRLGLEDVIEWRMTEHQKHLLHAKIESERIKKEEADRLNRIANGHIECSDIDKSYQDILYEKTVECSFNDLLEKCDLGEFVDDSDYTCENPNIFYRFRTELVGNEKFDKYVEEYIRKAHELWLSTREKLSKKEG